MFVKVHIPDRLSICELLRLVQALEHLLLCIPPPDDHVLLIHSSLAHMDKESHSIRIVFVLQGIVDIVGARRDKLQTLKETTGVPKLVVNAKLQMLRAIQQK